MAGLADLTLSQGDTALILLLAGSAGCSLETAPGDNDNWVERAGGLPSYVEKIACAVIKGGKPKGQAIAIAISKIKKWAAGGDGVDASTKAKAATALAQWNALKARNAAKKLSLSRAPDGSVQLLFSNTTVFNTETVRRAFEAKQNAERVARGYTKDSMEIVPSSWVMEMWTDHLIVSLSGGEGSAQFEKVPYTVDTDGTVSFGASVAIKQVWVEDYEDLTESELALLSVASAPTEASSRIMELSRSLRL